MKTSSLTILLIGLIASSSLAQDSWAIADSATVRLSPAKFPQLPRTIAKYLQRRGCTIPQTYMSTKPHNAVSGEFARRGQIDWAILCSRHRTSSILVFWHGLTKSISEIAKVPDKDYLQGISGDGKIGFSRAIGPVGKDYIEDHDKSYGGQKPPWITHQGINDAFTEKASVVRYFYRGKWLELQGAD